MNAVTKVVVVAMTSQWKGSVVKVRSSLRYKYEPMTSGSEVF